MGSRRFCEERLVWSVQNEVRAQLVTPCTVCNEKSRQRLLFSVGTTAGAPAMMMLFPPVYRGSEPCHRTYDPIPVKPRGGLPSETPGLWCPVELRPRCWRASRCSSCHGHNVPFRGGLFVVHTKFTAPHSVYFKCTVNIQQIRGKASKLPFI